jgi:hypothetical protein
MLNVSSHEKCKLKSTLSFHLHSIQNGYYSHKQAKTAGEDAGKNEPFYTA